MIFLDAASRSIYSTPSRLTELYEKNKDADLLGTLKIYSISVSCDRRVNDMIAHFLGSYYIPAYYSKYGKTRTLQRWGGKEVTMKMMGIAYYVGYDRDQT